MDALSFEKGTELITPLLISKTAAQESVCFIYRRRRSNVTPCAMQTQ